MLKNSPLKIYILFFTLTLGVYGTTYKAGFVTDFMGWLYCFDHYPFSAMLNSEANNIKSFYHFTHLLMYCMTAVFGRSGLPWFLLFSALFSLNAYFIFKLFIKIFEKLGVKNGEIVAFVGVLAFILSPYQAEVMVWRASFHYLTAFAMMLGYVHLVLKYLESPLPKYIYWAMGIFMCSVFALEFFLFTPFVVAVLLAFWGLAFTNDFINKFTKRTFGWFVFTPLSIIGIYFIFHRAIRGEWFAHGRGAANLQLISLESFSTYGKYALKELFFIRYLPFSVKFKIFSALDNPSVSWGISTLLMGISTLGLYYFKGFSAKNKSLFLCFGLFSLLLVPVLNLFFAWELWSENDRYGYMASAFLFMGFALVLSKLPKSVFYAFSIGYLLLSGYWLLKTNRIWWKSEKVYSQLTDSFHWWEADEVLVLNAPDNYAGIPMFRVYDADSGIREAVEVYTKRLIKAKMLDVLQYNMTSPTDGANVRVESDSVLVVTLNQWGNWWFRNGKGASAYETNDFLVKPDFNGCGRCYKLVLKNRKANRVILFQNGGVLKEVDMGKVGVEQY
jgi:hypothetical protein